MNPGALKFFQAHKDKIKGQVLEVGSMNINGSIRSVIPVTVGVDFRVGKDVDVVCDACDLENRFGPESFDAVVSCDALEHIQDWKAALENMWAVLKTDGWLVLTLASTNKGRHGYPSDYWRMKQEHLDQIFPGVTLHECGPISVGWAVQKTGPLNDLSGVTLLRV